MLCILPTTVRYNLPLSKKKCFDHFEEAITTNPTTFTLDHLKLLTSLLLEKEEYYQNMWGSIENFLPSSFPANQKDRDVMVGSASFPMLLLAGLETMAKVSRLTKVVADACKVYYDAETLKEELAKDAICGDWFPGDWKYLA